MCVVLLVATQELPAQDAAEGSGDATAECLATGDPVVVRDRVLVPQQGVPPEGGRPDLDAGFIHE